MRQSTFKHTLHVHAPLFFMLLCLFLCVNTMCFWFPSIMITYHHSHLPSIRFITLPISAHCCTNCRPPPASLHVCLLVKTHHLLPSTKQPVLLILPICLVQAVLHGNLPFHLGIFVLPLYSVNYHSLSKSLFNSLHCAKLQDDK